MTWARVIGLVSVLLAGGTRILAADPARLSVIGIYLGMTPKAVLATLSAQTDNLTRSVAPCRSDPRRDCVTDIKATLPDGSVDVAFRDKSSAPGAARVWRVELTIKARGAEDRDLVRGSAVTHYGTPTLDDPAWCWPDDSGRACRSDKPSLVFKPLDGAAGILILSAPGD